MTYKCSAKSGRSFRNTEFFTFEGDRDQAYRCLFRCDVPRWRFRQAERELIQEFDMSLHLYFHPLASFCHKALIALYENDTPFEAIFVDLGKEADRAALLKLWPVGKFPVLRDEARDQTVPESTVPHRVSGSAIIRAGRELIPADPDRAWQTRLRDRFYDLYVHEPMQKIVGDRLRPRPTRIRMASTRPGRGCKSPTA